MNKSITTKDFLLLTGDGNLKTEYTLEEVCSCMSEFTKLHVEQALFAVYGSLSSDPHIFQLMLNLYPLENIK